MKSQDRMDSKGKPDLAGQEQDHCICCGKQDTGWYSEVTMHQVIVLPARFSKGNLDWSLWEDKIGVKVPVCNKCLVDLELDKKKKIYCSAMALNLSHQEVTVFCSKCPDYMMMPVSCADCLSKMFRKQMRKENLTGE